MEEIQQTKPVQQAKTSHENPNKPIHRINRFALIALIFVCLLIAGLYGYYFIKSKTITQTIQPTPSPISTIPTTTNSPSPTLVLPTSEPLSTKPFVKRQFNMTEKFFSTQSFPSTLLSKNDNELTSSRCTERYENWSPSQNQLQFSYYNETSKKNIQLTDTRLLTFITAANKNVSSGIISSIQFCETENGKYIVIYSQTHGGGGAGSDTYFAYANPDNTLQKITTIPSEQGAYFACFQPLQLTKTNVFYYQCSGGEGNMASIYEVDLTNNSHKLFYQCEFTKPFSQGSTVTCK